MDTNRIPRQAIPDSQKTQQWKEDTVEAIIQRASLASRSGLYETEIQKLYGYYNGEIDPSDYTEILQPYGKQREKLPARIRNFNIIKPSVDLLLGEKAKQPFNWSVILSSPDAFTVKEYEKNRAVKENLYQWWINKLNEEGVDTGMESEEVELPEEIEEIFENNWKDNRVIQAQKVLNYLIYYLRFFDKMQKGWKDFLISGYVFSNKDSVGEEINYSIENPLHIRFSKDPESDFIEDGAWSVSRMMVSRTSVIDYFRETLTDEIIERLEHPNNAGLDFQYMYTDTNDMDHRHDDFVELVRVKWQSAKQIRVRKYENEFGEILEEEVDPEYEMDPSQDISVEDVWINEAWRGYRLDDDIYFNIGPEEFQNPSGKLSSNGRAYSDRNASNISLVKLGIPYQLTYNIFKYRMEVAIAKSKDMLAVLDINMIPEGWSMDKFMYMIEATGVVWVDYAKEGMQFNPQHQGQLDLTVKTIEQYLNLLNFVKQEWEYLSGITRQRMGEMSPYEGKATSQQAIIQSSHITEDYYRKFAEFEERELQGLLNMSQHAFINGKSATYPTDNGGIEYLNIDPSEFCFEEFGVFVQNAAVEQEKLNQMKAYSEMMIQNGAKASMIADIIDSDNFVELKSKVEQTERYIEQLEQQQAQREQELMEQQQALLQEQLEREDRNKELDRQNKIDIELIKQQMLDEGKEDVARMLEEFKIHTNKQLKDRELAEKERSNKANERLKEKEINVKKAQARSKNIKT